MVAIDVRNLTKRFDGFTAVDSISFEVEEGEVFGLLGPNGAGKTTTINMLSTILKPNSGSAKVAGYDIVKERDNVRRSIGIVFQEPSLDNKLTGRENLEFHAMMYGMSKEERKKRIGEVLELVDLSDKADVLVENYSGGMKRRLEIARGLIHKPKVLFLDEPTLGLDAQTRRHIWNYIKKLSKEGSITIILTTHYMEEADYLCDRVAIIDHGKIITMDTPKNLKDKLGGDVITFEVEERVEELMNAISKLRFVKSVKKHDGKLTVTVGQGEKRIPELIGISQKMGINIKSVSLHKPSLEDVFLHFTGKTIRESEASRKERNMMFARRRFGR
ncbi:MAG: ATP-binding cassette domain-containing protein [Candidatus Aenigmarchaeota archaeon]|nr:ATP-binding cassette domain-containing protein [Candidatus Aenigmarchaeota archaeon]